MGKILTKTDVRSFGENGYLAPVRVMEPDQAEALRQRVEAFETSHPDHVGKLDFKANLLFDWLDAEARRPRLLDAVEDILGPDLLHWNTTFRDKKPDGRQHAAWHQDTQYIKLEPYLLIVWVALTPMTVKSGTLQVIPGSQKWGLLPHAEGDDPDSILSRAQYITREFDTSEIDHMVLQPGEAGFVNHGIVHSSGVNTSGDRRLAMLMDFLPTSAVKQGPRDSAMLVRGADRHGNFDLEEKPAGAFGAAEIEAQRVALEKITQTLYEGSERTPLGLKA